MSLSTTTTEIFRRAIIRVRWQYREWPAAEWTYWIMAREIELRCLDRGVDLKCVPEIIPDKGGHRVRFRATVQPEIKTITITGTIA